MLKVIKNGITYEVRVESNNKLIGNFLPDVDGCYYFVATNTEGYWSDYVLIELGTKLKEINEGWYLYLDKELSYD
ncbi:hypothetical protein UFOVP449_257 [uncultured Caudovirales phage]|uniref:DUF5348 domain-containing protein n=1 Tax=uncultured Caudovirales phage TaxID=2100421 RepID=A0A6J5MBL1_9CAUD|nr:hypothetical protein UFOVP449_257 [uncultured Caudovirales phage]